MLWGAGSADSTDANRMSQFKALSSVPEWIIGFEEPDCATGSGSAGMSIAECKPFSYLISTYADE